MNSSSWQLLSPTRVYSVVEEVQPSIAKQLYLGSCPCTLSISFLKSKMQGQESLILHQGKLNSVAVQGGQVKELGILLQLVKRRGKEVCRVPKHKDVLESLVNQGVPPGPYKVRDVICVSRGDWWAAV